MVNKLKLLTENQLTWLLSLIAALVAIRVMYIQHGWINDDSTLYMEVAKRFAAGQYRQGATTFGLAKLIQLSGGDRLTIICGALILFSSPYITGDVLAMLLRDQGFWAFFLLSLVQFVRYTRSHRLLDAFGWQLCISLATLFRIEAIAYAMFLPVYLLISGDQHISVRFRRFIVANHLLLILLIAVTTFLFTSQYGISSLGRLREITELLSPTSEFSLAANFAEKLDIFAQQVLGKFLEDYAKFGLFVVLISITLVKGFKVAGPLSSLLMLAARKQLFMLPRSDAQAILLLTGSIASTNALVIIIRNFVLSSRYLVALGFIIIIFVAFYLASLIRQHQAKQASSHWQTLLLIVAFLMVSVGIVKNLGNKRSDYNYEQQAVTWVKQNKPGLNVYFGSARLRYYADATWAGRGDDVDSQTYAHILNPSTSSPYDCLVMRTEADEHSKPALFASQKQFEEIKRFENKAGNQIVVLCRKGM